MSNVLESVIRDEVADAAQVESAPEGAGVSAATRAAFNSRGFTSLLLTIVFVVLGFSGVMLYLMPRGRLANWSDWQLLGLAKEEWMALHVNISILFLVVAVLHLVLNWSLFWSYLRRRASRGLAMPKELLAAVVVSALFVAGPIRDYPPFRSIMALNTQIKDYWERAEAANSNTVLTASTSAVATDAGATREAGGSEETHRSNSDGAARSGGGPYGGGGGQGMGMGWGRRMGGGMGLGPGRGAGREEGASSSATVPAEGN